MAVKGINRKHKVKILSFKLSILYTIELTYDKQETNNL